MKPVYSYHQFILPFVIKGNTKTIDLNKSRNHWESVDKLPYLKDEKTNYAYHRYFNDEAMEIISDKKDLVRNFLYQDDSLKIYRISYYDDQNELVYFDLDLNYVMLRYYAGLDAAFLVFSVKNTRYPELSDIQLINQYGRRIYNPFLSDNKSILEAPNDLELLPKGAAAPIDKGHLDSYQIMSAPRQLLKEFFNIDSARIFPENDLPEPDKKVWLDIIIDDRMFVHSMIISGKSKSVINGTTDMDKLNLEKMKELYALAFIDKPNSPTCQSIDMLKKILAQTVYARWAEWNSLYLLTQHSFIFLSGSTVEATPDYLIDYFNSEYLDMTLITLIQRVGLLKYSHDAGARVSSSSKEILKLQREFVMFKNQFLLAELSAQEQAIDLYGQLQENLYIGQYSENLDNQINSLNDIAQIEDNGNLNFILLVIAIVTPALTAPILAKKLSCFTSWRILSSLKFLDIAIIILIIVFSIYQNRNRISKKFRKKR